MQVLWRLRARRWCSFARAARAPDFVLARGRAGHPRRVRALHQLLPILLAHWCAREHVIPIALHKVRSTFGAGEALYVEHVERLLWTIRPHHELAGRDRLPAPCARAP